MSIYIIWQPKLVWDQRVDLLSSGNLVTESETSVRKRTKTDRIGVQRPRLLFATKNWVHKQGTN